MVDSGSYVYVDGKIVLNSSRYITFLGGRARIRADIRDDVPDYCLHYKKIVEVPYQKPKLRSICAHRVFPRYNRHHDALYRESVKLPKREKTKNELEDAKLISSVNDVTRENILAIVGNAHRAGENFSEALTRFMSEKSHHRRRTFWAYWISLQDHTAYAQLQFTDIAKVRDCCLCSSEFRFVQRYVSRPFGWLRTYKQLRRQSVLFYFGICL